MKRMSCFFGIWLSAAVLTFGQDQPPPTAPAVPPATPPPSSPATPAIPPLFPQPAGEVPRPGSPVGQPPSPPILPPSPVLTPPPSLGGATNGAFNTNNPFSVPPQAIVTNGQTGQFLFPTNGFEGLGLTNHLAAMTPLRQAQVLELRNVLTSLQAAPATPDQVRVLQNIIISLARGPIQPSAQTINRLTQDLANVLQQATLPAEGNLAFAIGLNHVANSALLTPAQVESVIGNVQAMLTSAGVPPESTQVVIQDLFAMFFELRPDLAE